MSVVVNLCQAFDLEAKKSKFTCHLLDASYVSTAEHNSKSRMPLRYILSDRCKVQLRM